ncbi:hypothetical protein ISN45_At03g047490 [Arabidopsis thaliana x Arabidopsis arenosa]|uniref:Uncharacterized protein n=1 Tax=Arabidopsis thaliana x Arabidopsis arenosa TaxID=1240361 RepID=A0A8T2F1L3_9BRAS|nr:hypothetical protein ISN45_At03g047490 [Arabidopsis thaliana x Arabidopsis arenosa]
MALVMLARAPAPPLLLPSLNPQPCALPQDLTSLVSPSEPPDPPDPPDYLFVVPSISSRLFGALVLYSTPLSSSSHSIKRFCLSERIKEKTYDVLTRNDLGSWTPDLFIEKWWFSQPHTSPKLRFFSHLVGSRSWCFVAYAIVAVFHDAFYPLEDVASPDSRSPSVLFYFRKLISCFSNIGVSNFSCLTVMYASIFFFRVFRMSFVAVVSLAFVASLMYLLNHFSIVEE